MITITCILGNIAFITLAYLLRFSGTTMVILALSGVSLAIVSIVYYSRPKIKAKPLALPGHSQKESILKSHKILTLAGETVEQN